MPSTGWSGCCTGFKNESPLFRRRAKNARRAGCGPAAGLFPKERRAYDRFYRIISPRVLQPPGPGSRPGAPRFAPGREQTTKNASAGHGARAKLFSTLDCPLIVWCRSRDRHILFGIDLRVVDGTCTIGDLPEIPIKDPAQVWSKYPVFCFRSCLANPIYADISRSYFPFALEKIHWFAFETAGCL